MYVCLSACLSVTLSVCLSVCISVCLSVRCYRLTEFKSEQIAEQMTILDAQLFQKIEVSLTRPLPRPLPRPLTDFQKLRELQGHRSKFKVTAPDFRIIYHCEIGQKSFSAR